MIYHIAYPEDWRRAQNDGDYRISTRGMTLEQQGYIHASTASQVTPVANTFYAQDPDPIVLYIDEERVKPKIVYEAVPGSEEPFPHIYGPLNVDAVVDVRPLRRSADGHFTFQP
jgi:uncharacterized protein (DUF952 family)